MISRLLTVRKFGDSSEKMTMMRARARKARLSMRSFEMSSFLGAVPAAVEFMMRIRSWGRVRR